MTWKETCVMDEKIKFIADVLKQESYFRELCDEYGISRKTGYKWLNRYEEEGNKGLEDKSKAPLNSSNKIEDYVVEEIIKIKQKHLSWGPKKVRKKLISYNPDWEKYPAISTVGEYLKGAGLVIPKSRIRKAVPTQGILTKGFAPNEVWSTDFKGHFKTKDGCRCNPLTVSDDYSRYLLYCRHTNKMDYESVKRCFEILFREYGLPLVIRSDNGTPFSARSRYGLSKLSFWWIRLGIYPERIESGQPQQNGRHERMHKTLKAETANPPANSIIKQNERFRYFQEEYNEDRPHEALNMETPSSYYYKSGRRFISKLPKVEYNEIFIEKRKVQSSGHISYKAKEVFISEGLDGEYVGIEQIEEIKSNVWYCNYKLGILNHETGNIEPEIKKSFAASIN